MVTIPPWAAYQPASDGYDEGMGADGRWRPHVATALGAVRATDDLAALSRRMDAGAEQAGLTFPVDDGSDTFRVDPIPRIIDAAEWDVVERGVAQRALALDAFVADVHGPRRAVTEGVVPQRVIDSAEHHESAAAELQPPGGTWIGVAGLDLVRGPDGAFLVLEDNVRTPSGMAYVLAARTLTAQILGIAADTVPARAVDDAPTLLREVLAAAAATDGDAAGLIAVLTEGPSSSAYVEHRILAEHLGAVLVTSDQLALDGDDLVVRDAPDRPIRVVYRRSDDDRIDAPRHATVRAALAAGTVGMVNAFGTGVADDKLTHAYVEDLIRLYTGDEPVLRSVPTYDLLDDEHREEVLDRLAELVVKPRGGAGGHGVVIGPTADHATLQDVRATIIADPGGYVAQDLVTLSTAPTVVGGTLEPRHVDLRPFAFLAGGHARVLAGGLTRVALPRGSMVVNSSQDGGAKDTWVLE